MLNRIFVALLLIPPLLFIIFKGNLLILLAIEVCVAIMLYEFYSMIERKNININKFWGIVIGLLIPSFFYFATILRVPKTKFSLSIIVFTTIAFIIRKVIKEETKEAILEISYLIFGLIYIPLLFSYLIFIKDISHLPVNFLGIKTEEGRLWLLTTFLLAFVADTAAYFIGTFFGKNQLSPHISPKKSIEGFIGALSFGIITALAAKYFYLKDLATIKAIVLGLSASLMGQLGDLGASLFKRDSGIKDTSKLLMNHGGMLDRCDSLLFVAPFIYYFIKILVKA